MVVRIRISSFASLALVAGCATGVGTSATPAGTARPAPPSTMAGVVIMPPDSTDMPQSCRARGGFAPRPNAPPVFARGQHPEPRLDSLGLGQLWLRVYSTRDGQPLDPIFSLEPYPRAGGLQRVDATWARVEEPEGKYLLVVRNFFAEDWRDSVAIRRGFVDSLTLGLGNKWLCGL